MKNLGITILGCGLSGMITSLAFSAKGIKTTIIEARNTQEPFFFNDIRTTALTAFSKKIFQEINIWEEIAKILEPINDIYVVDNKAPEIIHFDSLEFTKSEIMGYLAENSKFKRALFECVLKNSMISILDKCSYSAIQNNVETCILTLNDNKKYSCNLIIICDGRHSAAKQRFFPNIIARDYHQSALTFIVKHDKPHEGTAVEHFMPGGPFAILPLQSPYNSSVVWTVKEERSRALINLSEEEFNFIIQENFGQFLGCIKIESKISVFPLIAYATMQYYNKKLVVVADSAHVIHPLAGQGFNQGIKDISTLVEIIAQYGITNQALSLYEKLRKQDNINMLEITDTLNTIFSNNSIAFNCIRQLGFKAIELFPPFKKILVKYAMGNRSI